MQISTYLNFKGNCADAIKFYEQALGAKVLFQMTWGESPMAKDCPPEMHGMIMHSTLQVGEGQIMCADSPPDRYEKPAGMSVSLHVKDARRSREALQLCISRRQHADAVSEDFLVTRFWHVCR
jgi:PhnB protein